MSKRKATAKVISSCSSSSSSASIASPIGLIIGSGSNKWRIGDLIGQGACASVHELQRISASGAANSNNSGASSLEWVIKLAGVPISMNSSNSNGKKRKKTDKERQADTVRLEMTLLSNKLGSLMGQFIPHIPLYGDKTAPPAHGEISTTSTLFTYIVMERMASPLASWATLLHDNQSTAAVAQQMLECIRQLHLLQLVYVDVKLDNFMLTVAPPNTASKNRNTTNPAPFLRLIDFGLVETLQDAMTGKHREDIIKGSPSAGTPIYASCNLMEGHTPSRRDDLEALGYVLTELLLLASHQQLPWAQASSDHDIFQSKKNATFYSLLSPPTNAKILQEYMKIVQQMHYYDKPDYEQLRNLLGQLVTGCEATTSSRTTTTTTTTTTTRSSTTKRSQKTKVVVDDCSTKPPATQLLSKAKNEYKTQQTHDKDGMEWEPILSSGEEMKENSAPPATTSACFQLTFTKGPLAGSSVEAFDGTTIVMGNDPKPSKNSVVNVVVVPDKNLSPQELKLAIQSTKWKAYSIRVTNVGSGSSTTKVKNKPLAKGMSIQCFAGDVIQFGSTTLIIEKVK